MHATFSTRSRAPAMQAAHPTAPLAPGAGVGVGAASAAARTSSALGADGVAARADAAPQQMAPGSYKGAWLPEHDAIILKCLAEGVTRWSEIADMIPGRCGKQCRERYINHLSRELRRETEGRDEEKGCAWCMK